MDPPIMLPTMDVFADRYIPTPLEAALIEEERWQLIVLKEAIEELAPTDRTVVQSLFFDGDMPADVADSLGLGPNEFQHELDRIYSALGSSIGQEESGS